MNPYLKAIGQTHLAAQARDDADDYLSAFHQGRATATECKLALSIAIAETRSAVKTLQEQVDLLVRAAEGIEERRAA